MYRHLQLLTLVLLISGVAHGANAAKAVNLDPEPEQWKGKPYDSTFQFSALTGLGVNGASTGFSIYGGASVKIAHTGFLDDVNDQAHVEVQAGPLFNSGVTSLVINGHLRWDFHKNDLWSFYALGGLGMTSSPGLTLFYPRFGIGAIWNLFEFLGFRAELSHELMAVGISYQL